MLIVSTLVYPWFLSLSLSFSTKTRCFFPSRSHSILSQMWTLSRHKSKKKSLSSGNSLKGEKPFYRAQSKTQNDGTPVFHINPTVNDTVRVIILTMTAFTCSCSRHGYLSTQSHPSNLIGIWLVAEKDETKHLLADVIQQLHKSCKNLHSEEMEVYCIFNIILFCKVFYKSISQGNSQVNVFLFFLFLFKTCKTSISRGRYHSLIQINNFQSSVIYS